MVSKTKSSRRYVREEAYGWNINLTTPYLQSFSASYPLDKSVTYDLLPNWKQVIQDGGNATTPLNGYEQSATQNPGVIRFKFANKYGGAVRLNTHCGVVSLAGFPAITNAQPLKDEAIARATASVYSEIRKRQTPFEGQVFAGELKETIQMLKNPYSKTAKLVDDFVEKARKARKRSKSKQHLDDAIASDWLALQYGLAPLFSDVTDLLNLAKDIAERRQHETIRGYGKSISASTTIAAFNGYPNGLEVDVTTIDTLMVQNIIRCGLTAKFLDSLEASRTPVLDSIDDITSIPVTAWELIPFSFLVDYFVNVGQIIESAVVSQKALSYVSNSLIVERTQIRTSSKYARITRPDIVSEIQYVTPKRIVRTRREVTRTGALLSIPPVVFHLPGSSIRYANIAALTQKLVR